MKSYKEKNNFIVRTTVWKCLVPVSKYVCKKLDFVMAKAASNSYTLDCSRKCPCTFPHSYA